MTNKANTGLSHPVCDLLRMEMNEAFKHVYNTLKAQGYKIVTDNVNYVFGIPKTKSINPIMLVAHVDTLVPKSRETGLHLKPVDLRLKRDVITNVNGVLGADDRAGVFAVLEAVKNGPSNNLPLVLFTNYEEVGGIGVKKFCEADILAEYADRISLLVEPDRAGFNEFVYYSWTVPEEVEKFVEGYGFHEAMGSYSDVKDITELYNIPHVNISVGYQSQHTQYESLNLTALDRTVKYLTEMLYATDVPHTRIPEKPPTVLAGKYTFKGHNSFAPYEFDGEEVIVSQYAGKGSVYQSTAQLDELEYEMALWLYDGAFLDLNEIAEMDNEQVVDAFWSVAVDIQDWSNPEAEGYPAFPQEIVKAFNLKIIA